MLHKQGPSPVLVTYAAAKVMSLLYCPWPMTLNTRVNRPLLHFPHGPVLSGPVQLPVSPQRHSKVLSFLSLAN